MNNVGSVNIVERKTDPDGTEKEGSKQQQMMMGPTEEGLRDYHVTCTVVHKIGTNIIVVTKNN